MLYTVCILAILIASILIILAVLVQNPKSGMAANFGAANQVMGVRESSNFLEKFTWTMAIAIVVLSLTATLVMEAPGAGASSEVVKDAGALVESLPTEVEGVPQAELPAEEIPAEEAPAAVEE
uniref:preprotein translocase subunit SecG n=1 Tax=Alistipes sp. TaxID=1872444 RepID=UPI0040566F7E